MFDVFKNVLAEIQTKISDASYKTGFKDVELISLDKSAKIATIGAPNVFVTNQLEARYSEMLTEAFKKNGVELEKIDFTVKSSKKIKVRGREVTEDGVNLRGSERPSTASNIAKRTKGNPSSTGLNSKFTLDNFVVGSSNELAAGVAKLIVDNPGDERFNPFFLYGGPGLGKTHLVHGIGNAIVEKHPNLKVLYIPMNHFYSEFINAVRANKADDFVKKYQKLDTLIIDDFQMIIG